MELEDNYSPPSSTKLKNVWSHTSTPPYIFMTSQGQLILRKLCQYITFEDSMVKYNQIVVSYIVKLCCSLLGRNRHFEGINCLHLHTRSDFSTL